MLRWGGSLWGLHWGGAVYKEIPHNWAVIIQWPCQALARRGSPVLYLFNTWLTFFVSMMDRKRPRGRVAEGYRSPDECLCLFHRLSWALLSMKIGSTTSPLQVSFFFFTQLLPGATQLGPYHRLPFIFIQNGNWWHVDYWTPPGTKSHYWCGLISLSRVWRTE